MKPKTARVLRLIYRAPRLRNELAQAKSELRNSRRLCRHLLSQLWQRVGRTDGLHGVLSGAQAQSGTRDEMEA